MSGSVLFCYDGSEGSRAAMAAPAELVAHPAPAAGVTKSPGCGDDVSPGPS
jgi:hypothetical protein